VESPDKLLVLHETRPIEVEKKEHDVHILLTGLNSKVGNRILQFFFGDLPVIILVHLLEDLESGEVLFVHDFYDQLHRLHEFIILGV
jgi:hypothetical protein